MGPNKAHGTCPLLIISRNIDEITSFVTNLRTGPANFDFNLTPGAALAWGVGLIAQCVLLVQFIKKRLCNSLKRVGAAGEHSIRPSSADPRQLTEHVMVNVVFLAPQHKRIVFVIID